MIIIMWYILNSLMLHEDFYAMKIYVYVYKRFSPINDIYT